jgi:hypothetical protein
MGLRTFEARRVLHGIAAAEWVQKERRTQAGPPVESRHSQALVVARAYDALTNIPGSDGHFRLLARREDPCASTATARLHSSPWLHR